MTIGKSYAFNGSTFGVQTALAVAKIVTNITAANPPVATVAAHGYVLGDVVKLDNIDAPTQLDGGLFPVDNPNTNDFELFGVNGLLYAAFVAGTPDATAQKVTFSEFCELTGANQQDGGADQHDVSTICSTAKEFKQGLSDSGTLQLDFNWAGNETVQAAMRAAKVAATPLAFKITFPEDGGTVIMAGTVQQTSFQGSVSAGVWTASATIKLSGEIAVLEAV